VEVFQQERPRGAIVLTRRGASARDFAWWVERLSWGNLAFIGVVVLLVCVVSERWWLSALLTYLPRQPYAIPALILLPLSLFVCWRVSWVNLAALVLVAGPLMGLSLPLEEPAVVGPGRTRVKVASGNLQNGKGILRKLREELRQFDPDIVVFQEAAQGCDELLADYSGWESAHLISYFVASRYPLRVVDPCKVKAFQRWSAVLVEIDTPDGTVRIGDVHLMTARHGATGITLSSPLSGNGVDEFEWHLRLRDEEAQETRDFFDRHHEQPLLLAGDFNTPTTSSHFTSHWSGFQSAFETAGRGYGYTAPCNASRLWFENTPWLRIDHLLADDAWSIHSCRIGETNGSDHRLLFTEVSLK